MKFLSKLLTKAKGEGIGILGVLIPFVHADIMTITLIMMASMQMLLPTMNMTFQAHDF